MTNQNILICDGTTGDVSSLRIVIAVSSYNKPITGKLLDGAIGFLQREGFDANNISVVWVPGAWELALATSRVIEHCDAVICLGAVIKGDTSHDQYINSMISSELGRLSVDHKKPVSFGVLTCDTVEQAMARSGGSVGNKGEEAANAAICMLRLFKEWGNAI